MVLVDTSVWISHLRQANPQLKKLLLGGHVLCHPFIVVEIACGQLTQRKEILSLLNALPTVKIAEHEEAIQFIQNKHIFGEGIGFVDAHLLAAAFLSKIKIWTLDKKLQQAALKLHVLYELDG